MARVNKSQYTILGMLSKSPQSGYDIKNILSKMAPFFWAESNAQIYPILKKLEQQNWVSSTLDESSGARQRRLYSITETGRAEFIKWLEQDTLMPQYREELLLKISFGQFVDNDVLLAHLNHYQNELEQRLQLLTKVQAHIATDHTGRPDQPYLTLTYEFARHTLEAKLAWCVASQKRLQP